MTTRRLPSHLTLLLGTLLAPGCYTPHDVVVDSNDDSGGSEADSSSGSATSSPTTTAPTSTDATTTDSTTNPSTTATTDDTETGETTSADSTDGEPVCGDGMVEGDEVCDDGVNDGSYGGCEADCAALGPHCGDSVEQGDEVCDDGDEVNGDGCNIDCVVSGSEIWTRMFAGAEGEDDGIYSVAVLPEDEIVAAGGEGTGANSRQAWLRRYDGDGSIVWTSNYAGPTGDYITAYGVGVDDDGDIYAAGSYEGITDSYNGWVRKHDGDAAEEYLHTFNGTADGYDTISDIAVSEDGYAVVTGRVDSGPNSDFWLRRLGQDGSEFWTRSYDGGENDLGEAVALDSAGNVIACGTTDLGAENDAWIRKYDSDGGTIWTRTYDDSTNSEVCRGVAVDSMDRVTITGSSTLADYSDGITWLRQYDADGAVVWTEIYGGAEDFSLPDTSFAIATDSGDNLVVVGQATSEDDSGMWAWVRKYASDGQELWTRAEHVGVPTSQAVTVARGVTVDSQQNIIVVGLERLDGGDYDGWIRKLAP